MPIIAVVNQKGGVAKTTTAVNLGGALATHHDQRVLVVDVDPQAHATMLLTANAEQDPPTVGLYEVLAGERTAEEVVCPSHQVRLDVCPATIALARAETQFLHAYQREGLLQRALADLVPRYGCVILDCPPSLGLLTHMALTLATDVLIPLMPERLALQGMADLFRTIRTVQDLGNPTLRILGLLITRYNRWPRVYRDLSTQLEAVYADLLFQTLIPQGVIAEEAAVFGLPVIAYAPDSPVAQAYTALAQEVVARLQARRAP